MRIITSLILCFIAICLGGVGTAPLDPPLLRAIIEWESGGNPHAPGDYNKKTKEYDALGVLQIHKKMVLDCNRICKLQGSTKRYTYEDRLSPAKSKEMFYIYQDWYIRHNGIPDGMSLEECIARRWNGGPDGETQESTLGYWQHIQDELKKINAYGG